MVKEKRKYKKAEDGMVKLERILKEEEEKERQEEEEREKMEMRLFFILGMLFGLFIGCHLLFN